MLYILILPGRNGIQIFQKLAAEHNWVVTQIEYFRVHTNVSEVDVRPQLYAIKNKGKIKASRDKRTGKPLETVESPGLQEFPRPKYNVNW